MTIHAFLQRPASTNHELQIDQEPLAEQIQRGRQSQWHQQHSPSNTIVVYIEFCLRYINAPSHHSASCLNPKSHQFSLDKWGSPLHEACTEWSIELHGT